MSCRDRKRIHLDKSAFILFPQNDLAPEKATCHPLSSPTQFHGCDSSGVCDSKCPLPPRRRRTSAAARPPRRGPPAPPIAAAFGLGEAATRLAPRVKAWANESWKTRKLRKLRIPKIVSPGRANIARICTPSDKRMPREIQGEEGSVANEETVTRGWERLCPGELRNPLSSCCGRCVTKMQTSPENQSRSWHKCSLFWFDTLEIWKLQLGEMLLLFFNIQVHDRGWVGPVACVPKALTQGLGFLNRLEDRLEEQSSTACGCMWQIRWDWHFCWWPAKSILCEGWLNHQTPSGKTKTRRRLARERKTHFSSSSEYGSRKK